MSRTWDIVGLRNNRPVVVATVKELELHDEWMGECFLTVTVKSAGPVEFKVGDYIDYRGERYTIDYDPTVLKKARRSSYGEGFVYDNIKFAHEAQAKIVRCDFTDIVLDDNNIHYTSLSTFPFFCETVDDLLDRIQANLDELYGNRFIIVSADESRSYTRGNLSGGRASAFAAAYAQWLGGGGATGNTSVALTADNIKCWDAMRLIHDSFGLNFIQRGYVIAVGTAGLPTGRNFTYGKGNGLYEIERIGDSSQELVTRLRAYGNTTNMPVHYYADVQKKCFAVMTDGSGNTDVPYNKNMFATVSQAGESSITVKVGDVEMSAIARINGVTGNLIIATSPFIEADKTVYIASGAVADKWPNDYTTYVTDGDALPNHMAVGNLMLPGFPKQSLAAWVRSNRPGLIGEFDFSDNPVRPYIDAAASRDAYGIRPSGVTFDGSDGRDDIYPTLSGSGKDHIVGAEQISDSGMFIGEDVPNFKIKLPDLGFDLGDAWQDGTAIEMKNGMCGGRSFTIASKPTKNDDGQWLCNCQRSHDTAIDLWFPYSEFQLQAGDSYVLTGIEMPATYIEDASVRLFDAAIEFLRKNCSPRVTYQPMIDEIWMQRQDDEAKASNGLIESLHDTLKAGDVFQFSDDDLGIEGAVIIDVLAIKENGNNGIPTYDITLRDDKEVSAIQKIQNSIDSLGSGNGTGGGGLTGAQMKRLVESKGRDLFLSKVNNDVARGLISFLRGLQIGEDFVSGLLGEGGIFRRDADGTTYLEADKMYVRMKAYFDTVEIRKFLHSGGNRIASVAGAKCVRVVPFAIYSGSEVALSEDYRYHWTTVDPDTGEEIQHQSAQYSDNPESTNHVEYYRCYFRGSDGDDAVTNDFIIGDQAYCHITNGDTQALQQHHYWRLVLGKSNSTDADSMHYIDLSNHTEDTLVIEGAEYKHAGFQTGSDVPSAQDDIVQLGNIADKTRQGAIIEYVSGEDAPSYQIYQGIDDFNLEGKNYVGIGYNSHTGRAYMNVYGDAYIGDKAQDGGYMEYDSNTHTLNIMGHLRVGSTLEDGRDINTLGTKRGNLLRNTGFTGDYKSEPITAHTHVNPNTVIFSDPLAHWVADQVTVISSEESVSGMAAQIGSLQQEIDGGLTIGEWYILSFRARGSVVNYSIGGVSGSISLTPVVTRYDIPLLCGQDTPLRLEGKATVMELQLMAGSLPTEWQKSYRDNDRAMAEYHALKYLRDAITGANTDIIGGLILSQILKVGNYRNGVMMEETGGISGARNDDNSPFLWGGGSMEQAIYTIMKYASDPSQAVTDTDLSNMAKFVVTHGGRAILTDIILRGWIYARGGEINGNLNVVGGSINAKAGSSTDNGQGNILKCTKTYYQANAVWGNRYKTESGIVSGIWWKCRKYNNLDVNVYKVNLTTKVKIGIKSFPYRSTWTEGELVRLAFDSIVTLEKDEYIGIDAPIYFTDTLTDSSGKSFFMVGTTVGGSDNTAIGFYSYYDTSSRSMVQVNGKGDSVSESGDVTIIDSRGFYIKRGNNGFRLTTNGLERWNPKAVTKTIGGHFTTEGAWQPFYSTRFVRNVEINNGGWYELNEYDDFVIVKVVNSGSGTPWIKLPLSNISSGKVITIKATGTTINVTTRQSASESDSEANKLILYGNGNTKVSYKDLNDSHRAELVYDGQYWWWNYMDV